MSTVTHCSNRRRFQIAYLSLTLALLLFGNTGGWLCSAQEPSISQPKVSQPTVPQPVASQPESARQQAAGQMLALPLHFEPATDNTLTSRTGRLDVQVGKGGAVSLSGSGHAPVTMTLTGASANLPKGENPLPGKSNYLLGNDPSRWRHGVEQFSKARVDGVYPGIDLLYYGNGKQLEHDYLIAPNADAAQIEMRFDGAKASLDKTSGDLILNADKALSEAIRLKKPIAYQQNPDGSHQPVDASYRSDAKGSISFSLGKYDHSKPLVIDPVILYSTYFGGVGQDIVQDLKVDSAGNIYFLMNTNSGTLPQKGNPSGVCEGACSTANSPSSFNNDFYVAKLDVGGQLDFATYIGGSMEDNPSALALDANGNIYISGETISSDFPVKNAYQGGLSGQGALSGTLTKLSADGSQLLYSTYIGYGDAKVNGSNISTPNTLALGLDGIAYIIGFAGYTGLDNITPVNPFFKEGQDFVAKFDTTKSGAASLLFASPVGDDASPSSIVFTYSIASDSKGDLWVYGQTFSFTFPKPTSDALQPSCGTLYYCENGFLLEINAAGSAISYASFAGGNTEPLNTFGLIPLSMSIDSSDDIYLLGNTTQTDYPLKNQVYGYEIAPNGDQEYGFMTKLGPGGKPLLYSTLFPLYTGDVGITVFPCCVTGTSTGLAAISVLAGYGEQTKNALPTPALSNSHVDGFFYLLDATQSGDNSLLIASYLGSSNGATFPFQIQFDPSYNLVIGGETSATDFPVVNPYQAVCASDCNNYDGFLIRIQPLNSFSVVPSSLTFSSTAVGASSPAMTANFINATTSTIHTLAPVLSDPKDFIATGDCSTIEAGSDCTVTFTFTPQSSGTLTATYSLASENVSNPTNQSTSSSPLVVQLSGTATGAVTKNSLTPTSVDFGTEYVNHGTTKVVTYTNNSASSAVTISGKTITPSVFTVVTDNCGSTVAANSSCTYVLFFEPTTVQTFNGTFMVMDGGANPSVSLTGVGSLTSSSLSPTSINFGTVYESQNVTQTVTYTNNGPTYNTITAAATTPPIFVVAGTTCGKTVASGASCTYTLSYTPFGVGAVQGSFTVTDGASNPSVALSATAIQPPTNAVNLVPSALTFPNVVVNTTPIPFANLAISNQSSSTITILATDFNITGSGASAFSYNFIDSGIVGDCQYALAPFRFVLGPKTSCLVQIFFSTQVAPDATYNALLTAIYTFDGDSTRYTTSAALTGNTIQGPTPAVSPSSIQFPATPNGAKSLAKTVTLSNSGDESFAFTGISISGANPNAFSTTNNCPASITRSTPCQISIVFTPPATGNEFTATLQVLSGSYEHDVALAGGTSPSDFVLSTPSDTSGGKNPTWTINIAPLTASTGFYEPIKFIVTGLDPSYGTPVFTPSTVTPKGGTTSTTLTLTPPSSSALNHGLGGAKTALPILAFCIAFVFGFRRKLENYRSRIATIITVLTLTALALTGCTNQKHAVNFTVTATSGDLTHSVTLTLLP